MPSKLDTSLYNLSGALIFTGYVLSALFLTIFLTIHLTQKHYSLPPKKAQSTLHSRLQIFTALSVISFSMLSYNMLQYLIASYRTWAAEHSIPLPQRWSGEKGLLGAQDQRVQIHVWQWLTTSTLFQDFAQTICGDSARFWWTQQALLVTMGWTVFMSVEGM